MSPSIYDPEVIISSESGEIKGGRGSRNNKWPIVFTLEYNREFNERNNDSIFMIVSVAISTI